MKEHFHSFGGGIGTGAAITALVALTCLWRPGLLRGWLTGESALARARRDLLRAAERARLSPNYLDACRAAGL